MFNSDSPEGELVETWQRFVQGVLGVLALAGAGVMAHYYAPPETSGLERQVHQLTSQVADLERQQSFSPAALDNARESVAYVYGIYHLSGHAESFRARVSGTGFVVAPGLLAMSPNPGMETAKSRRPSGMADRQYWKSWWHIFPAHRFR